MPTRHRSLREALVVTPGPKVRIANLDPNDTHGHSRARATAEL